jgi:NADH:ubiquinone oxidoreductase subunit 6 (subunit J)
MKVFGNVSDYTGFVSSYSIVFTVALLSYWLYISIASSDRLIPVSETLEIINRGYNLTPKDQIDNVSGTAVLASILYNYFWHLYLIAGVVLLVALIGASVLTRQVEDFSVTNE